MKRYLTPWIALAAGLVLTTLAGLEVKGVTEQNAVDEFSFTSDQITLKIQERLAAYALILKGGASLFAASNAVDRFEWQAYVEKLRSQDSVPGVQGIGFSQVIPAQQLAAHTAQIRAQGFPEYTVRPEGNRSLYTSIVFLEPFRDRNLRAFGFDMFSEPVRRTAMERARDSGLPTLSGKVELVQETATEVQAGTLMYVPVYRNGARTDTVEQRRAALIGWAYSPYRMKDLLEGVLSNWNSYRSKRVHLQIFDGLEVGPNNNLYNSHNGIYKVDPLYDQRRTIDFNGQHWLLRFHAGEGLAPISYANAWATFAGGVVLSSLLCGLMLALGRTQVRARRIADTLTADLKRSGDLLRESEAALKTYTHDFDAFLQQTSDFVYFKDANGRIRFCSKTLADITGHRHWREMVGKRDRDIFPPDIAKIYEEEEAPVLAEGRPLLHKVDPYYDKHGQTGYVETNKWPLFDVDGKVIGIFGISRDITERKKVEADRAALHAQIFQLAYIDTLTGLPNRRMLEDRLSQAMATGKRSGLYGALIFLDLDNFKPLNDAHGHGVGDLLLIEVAARLSACVREVDTVAREGGDEFVVVLSELGTDIALSTELALNVAEKIRAVLAAPYLLRVLQADGCEHTVEHHCAASIGVAMFLGHQTSNTEVMRWADAAMYQAKDAGRNRVCLHTQTVTPAPTTL